MAIKQNPKILLASRGYFCLNLEDFYSVVKKVPKELTVAVKLLPSILAPVCSVEDLPSNKNNLTDVEVSDNVIVSVKFFTEKEPAVKTP